MQNTFRNNNVEKGIFIRHTIIADSFIPSCKLKKRFPKSNKSDYAKKMIKEVEAMYESCDEQPICLYTGMRALIKKVTCRSMKKIEKVS
jgi:hypothetical protein